MLTLSGTSTGIVLGALDVTSWRHLMLWSGGWHESKEWEESLATPENCQTTRTDDLNPYAEEFWVLLDVESATRQESRARKSQAHNF